MSDPLPNAEKLDLSQLDDLRAQFTIKYGQPPPATFTLIDDALFANNPTTDRITLMKEYFIARYLS